MGLRTDQSKLLLEMYLDGASIVEIANHLKVSSTVVKGFIPKGELNVAYQNVRDARAKSALAESKFTSATQADKDLKANLNDCTLAIGSLKEAIAANKAELKSLNASMKAVKARLVVVKDTDSGLEPAINEHKQALAALDKAEDRLKHEKAVTAARAKEKHEKEQRIKKAEMLAEQAIITAAIAGAKDLVAKSVNDRLDREEKQDAT